MCDGIMMVSDMSTRIVLQGRKVHTCAPEHEGGKKDEFVRHGGELRGGSNHNCKAVQAACSPTPERPRPLGYAVDVLAYDLYAERRRNAHIVKNPTE